MAARSSKHLVDPELLPLLELLPTVNYTDEVLQLARNAPRPSFDYGPVPGDVEMQQFAAPGRGDAPPVAVHLYRPPNRAELLACILHMHGGGYVRGSSAMYEPQYRIMASEIGCAILSVDYRLAPETRFPGAVEDCYAALAWLHTNSHEYGIDVKRIGVMGESAGGGLAAALALMARDRGEYPIAFQHLIYPMIDDRTCVTQNPSPYTGEFIWTPESNRFGWRALLGVEPGSPGVSKYAAAARETDLTRLPPTYLSTAALDLFVDENLDYAQRLMRAGIPVELRVYPGAMHGFELCRSARVAQLAKRDSFEALRRYCRRN